MLAIYKHQLWILLGIWATAGGVCICTGMLAAFSGNEALAIFSFALVFPVEFVLITGAWLRPYQRAEKKEKTEEDES